jgi:hypothetical protein
MRLAIRIASLVSILGFSVRSPLTTPFLRSLHF